MRHTCHSGFAMLEIAVALSLLGLGLGFFIYSQSASQAQQRKLLETVAAKSSALELIELFRSFHRRDVLIGYMTPRGFKFCETINELNRSTSSVQKADPTAVLSESVFPGSAALKANRDYRVDVIDISTMDVISSRCGQTASAPTPALGANERLLVTVGVSWVPLDNKVSEARRVTLSTLLPE